MTTAGKAVALDVETTGTNIGRDEIVELALVGLAGHPQGLWRFRPRQPIPDEAIQVHGITNDAVAACPRFEDHAGQIFAVLEEAEILVGYNLTFDLQMLDAALVRCAFQVDWSPKLLLDPLRLWQALEPRTLAVAYSKFVGGPLQHAHSALADAVAAGRVLDGLRWHFGVEGLSPEELADLSDPDRKSRVGLTNHLVRNGKELVFNFGKYAGVPVSAVARREPSYLRWLQSQDFPLAVKRAVDSHRYAHLDEYEDSYDHNEWGDH